MVNNVNASGGMRERILDAASEIYLEHGLRALTMRRVATHVGVSATAIYRHFESKEDLLLGLVDQGFRLFGDRLYRALEAATPVARLAATGQRYIDFALQHPGYYGLIFVTPQFWSNEELPPAVRKRSHATFRFLVDRVQECMDAGWLARDQDAERTAHTIWALTHGLVTLHLARKREETEQEFRESFQIAHAQLIQGLQTRKG